MIYYFKLFLVLTGLCKTSVWIFNLLNIHLQCALYSSNCKYLLIFLTLGGCNLLIMTQPLSLFADYGSYMCNFFLSYHKFHTAESHLHAQDLTEFCYTLQAGCLGCTHSYSWIFFNHKLNLKKPTCVSLRCSYLIGNYTSFITIFLVMLFFVTFH